MPTTRRSALGMIGAGAVIAATGCAKRSVTSVQQLRRRSGTVSNGPRRELQPAVLARLIGGLRSARSSRVSARGGGPARSCAASQGTRDRGLPPSSRDAGAVLLWQADLSEGAAAGYNPARDVPSIRGTRSMACIVIQRIGRRPRRASAMRPSARTRADRFETRRLPMAWSG